MVSGWETGTIKDLIKSLDAGVSVNAEENTEKVSKYKILKTSCVSQGFFEKSEIKSVYDENEIAKLKEPVKANRSSVE
ncbi:hypothetical protein [Actinobacillus vicugnae]|uniref:hypothetical protein n=1 Tax=Actinobacillus vicugnae TaxID=2573093 RepID=UPI001240357F|nr:hypothetical protein [Actinobacillus vicugnae]